jgi:hypothetical protein
MRRALLGLVLILWGTFACAHKPSDSYLSLKVEGASVHGQWDIALRDLDYAIGLDENDDGAITWGELRRRKEAINAYALSRLQIDADGEDCLLQARDLLVDGHTDGNYAVIRFDAICSNRPQALALVYNLFFELDPQHRGLLRLQRGERTDSVIFSPETPRFELTLNAPRDPWREFLAFGREGVWHIWIGYDHILFLLSLLLPAALVREAGRWRAVSGFRRTFWDVFKIVTAFTLAHSITLSLATLKMVELPSRWVESAIAASVAAAALNNLYPVFLRRRATLAFAFGLIHGLGFAAVLLDLGLPDHLRLLGLVGFNLGVEVGQLAIVGVILPLAYGLSRFRLYSPLVLKLGSACIAGVAFLWLAERSLDLRLMPF